jgi:hypothetical protein
MDFSRCLIFGNIYSGPLRVTTLQWVRTTFPPGNAWLVKKPLPLVANRNTAIRDDVLPRLAEKEYDWVFFIDNDVTITHPGIERFLEIDADVVSCNCPMNGTKAWDTIDAFHNHFWRCRPAVLQTIHPPWFAMPTSVDGCDLLGCECLYFRQKALAAGFTIKHGGYCGHANAGTWRGGTTQVQGA